MEILFPVEFVVTGTPVSFQGSPRRIQEWKTQVAEASKTALPNPHFASGSQVEVVLYYFPAALMDGDLDNIIKPILDAISAIVIIDDKQVDRLVVQRFDPSSVPSLPDPTDLLQDAMASEAHSCRFA